MADSEMNLKEAVNKARSAFYAFKGKKRKETRKEARRAARIAKKSKSKNKKTKPEDNQTTATEQKNMKKRKRKRKPKPATPTEEDDKLDDAGNSNSAYEAANKMDEKLISSLEKKLGMKKKRNKMSNMFKEDGLDYILEVCESFTEDTTKGYNSDEEYLKSKSDKSKKKQTKGGGGDTEGELSDKSRQHKLLFGGGDESGDDEEEEEENELGDEDDLFKDGDFDDDDLEEDDLEDDDLEDDTLRDDDDLAGDDLSDGYEDDGDDDLENDDDGDAGDVDDDDDDDDDDEEQDTELSQKTNKTKQKRCLTEETQHGTNQSKSTKYIPPALRKKLNDDQADKWQQEERIIKKKLKGLLNRLSDGTVISVLSEIESMYANNSRNRMNEILLGMFCEACASSIPTPERLVLLNTVIIAALHVVIGQEIGAYFLQMLCEKYTKLHEETPLYGEGKSCHNALLILVSFYNLKIVDAKLIYDLLRTCVSNFRQQDIELIFLVLKSCGIDLRKDDPAALKEIIVEVQSKAAEYPEEDRSYLDFVLETMTALKNNNTRKIPLYDGSVVDDARKSLKLVLQGRGKNTADTKLNISLTDLLEADKKGRWWITGSAWAGRDANELKETTTSGTEVVSEENTFSANVLKAAKKQRMNTALRKQIFCVIVSSEDYVDAFEKLLKLNLTEKQFREVVHVLLDCCLQGKVFNPFYAHVATKLCEFDKSNQVTFQYSIWDRFKTLATMKKNSLNNLERLLSHMVVSKALSLSILKVVSFGALDGGSVKFFTSFFTDLLLNYPQSAVKATFQRIASLPKLSLLRQGIKLFLRQHLYTNEEDELVNDVKRSKLKEMVDIVDLAIDGHDYMPL